MAAHAGTRGGNTGAAVDRDDPTVVADHPACRRDRARPGTGYAAWLSWQEAWREAERELERTAEAVAAYGRGAIESYRVAAQLLNQMLLGLTDEQIRLRELEVHEQARTVINGLFQVSAAGVLDRHGAVLLSSVTYPVAGASGHDREWMTALRQPNVAPAHVSQLTQGRTTDLLFFAVSIRRSGTGNGVVPGAFDGVVTVTVDPNAIGEGLRALLPHNSIRTIAPPSRPRSPTCWRRGPPTTRPSIASSGPTPTRNAG
jgi:hypothetical protein